MMYYIFASLILLFGAYVVLIDVLKKKRCTEKLNATIIDITFIENKDNKKNKRSSFKAVYQYEINNKIVKINGIRSYKNADKFHINDVVELYCNPKKLNEFYTKDESRIIPGSIIAFFGLLCLLAAVL